MEVGRQKQVVDLGNIKTKSKEQVVDRGDTKQKTKSKLWIGRTSKQNAKKQVVDRGNIKASIIVRQQNSKTSPNLVHLATKHDLAGYQSICHPYSIIHQKAAKDTRNLVSTQAIVIDPFTAKACQSCSKVEC